MKSTKVDIYQGNGELEIVISSKNIGGDNCGYYSTVSIMGDVLKILLKVIHRTNK